MTMRSILVAALAGFFALPAAAQDNGQSGGDGESQSASGPADPQQTVEELLQSIRDGRARERSINQERIEEFREKVGEQEALLNESQQQLQALKQRSQNLESTFNDNEVELGNMEEQLKQRMGAFGQLFEQVRETAGKVHAQIKDSMTSAQLGPERLEFLSGVASSESRPDIADIERVWYEVQRETVELGRTVRFSAPVVQPEGSRVDGATVVRVGPFTAIQDGDFLRYNPDERAFLKYGRQPGLRFVDVAESFDDAQEGVVAAPFDPSRGEILARVVQAPGFWERIDKAGVIGYIIIGFGILGALIAIERLLVVGWTERKVKKQVDDSEPDESNPLGRVMLEAKEHDQEDNDVLELHMEEAILKERPKLDRGLNIVKVLIAASPLMGLLGTVVGMIQTFEMISLYGSGDPQLMAGGISQALITTMLGLSVALPLLLLHSLAKSRVDSVIEILDEQSTGIVAEHALGQQKQAAE